MKSNNFIIPLNGLHTGKTYINWHVGKEFFVEFGNSDIIDADIKVSITIDKSGTYLGIDCSIVGTVVVSCDRCLEELSIPVDTVALLSIKYGSESTDTDNNAENEGREVLYLSEDEAEMNMEQVIYDYSLLALPMHKVHKSGDCNPVVLKYLGLSEELPEGEIAKVDNDDKYNPFEVLKGLL